MLISCAVTAQLICGLVFAYAKNPVFHEVAHLNNIYLIMVFQDQNIPNYTWYYLMEAWLEQELDMDLEF